MNFPMIGNNDYKIKDNNKLIITSSAEDTNYKKNTQKMYKKGKEKENGRERGRSRKQEHYEK